MKLINKSKNLDEKDFIMRLQNGYILFVEYEYEENNKQFEIYYTLLRYKDEGKSIFLLTIRAGDPNYWWEPADQRDERYEFSSSEESLKFLKEKENFKISDWGYRRRALYEKK